MAVQPQEAALVMEHVSARKEKDSLLQGGGFRVQGLGCGVQETAVVMEHVSSRKEKGSLLQGGGGFHAFGSRVEYFLGLAVSLFRMVKTGSTVQSGR